MIVDDLKYIKEDASRCPLIDTTKQFAPAGTWSADPVHSNVSFEVAYAGVNTFRGSFREFTATLADGRARGLGAGRERRREGRAAERPPPDAGLLRRRALPRDHVPGGDDLERGELTIKGVTHPIELTASISEPNVDPFGRERLGLRLETTIDRNDVRRQLERAQPGRRQLPRRRREAHRRARARPPGGLTMKILAVSGSLRRRLAQHGPPAGGGEARPGGRRGRAVGGDRRPADLRPGSRRRRRPGERPPAPRRLGRGGRDPLRDARVQRLRARRPEERRRLGVAPEGRGRAR